MAFRTFLFNLLCIAALVIPSAHAEELANAETKYSGNPNSQNIPAFMSDDPAPYLEELSTVGMVTGSQTGTYYRFGQDIMNVAEEDGLKVSVKESGGSIDNIARIASTENAAIGIVQSDVLGFLIRSERPESRHIADNLRLVFPFYQEEVHVIANKNIKSFKDLQGKAVVVGPEGSGSWLTSSNMFNLTNVRPGKILRKTPEEGLLAVLRGRADAMVYVAGKPVRLFENMATLASSANKDASELIGSVHFVPLDMPILQKEYSLSTITSNDYKFVKQEVPTIAVTSVLVAYDFSGEENPYTVARCNHIHMVASTIRNHIDKLKRSGHKKWQEVDLNAEVGIWKRDACAMKRTSTSTLEAELLQEVHTDW